MQRTYMYYTHMGLHGQSNCCHYNFVHIWMYITAKAFGNCISIWYFFDFFQRMSQSTIQNLILFPACWRMISLILNHIGSAACRS